MNPSQSTTEETVYGSEATYKQLPDEASTAAGVIPLDTLPAAWWNALWNQQTKQDNNAYADINDLRQEVLSVLSSAPSPITPSTTVHNQLYNAIEQIRQIVATVTVAGAVKSSSDIKSVAVDAATGAMLVNALVDWSGTKTVKETIDDLDSTIGERVDDIESRVDGLEPLPDTDPWIQPTTITGVPENGTSTHAARVDHQHAIGFDDSIIPTATEAIVDGNNQGVADAPARADHRHAVSIRSATTAQTGIVRLNSATNSTSTTQAATASAVNSVRAAVATVKAVISSSATGTTNANGRYLNIIWTAPGATSASVLSSVDLATYAHVAYLGTSNLITGGTDGTINGHILSLS